MGKRYGVYATITALLFTGAIAYAVAYSVSTGLQFESAALPLILGGGFVSGLLYGLAFRFKGLLFSLLVGFFILLRVLDRVL